MNALLLIDIQNDFLPGGALAVPDGDRIIPVVNRLTKEFDIVVATMDWHPPHHKSFASSHKGKQVGEVVKLKGLDQILWPDHCIQNTYGAALSENLDTVHLENTFVKGTDPEIDSYSGFYDNGHLRATGLTDFLRHLKVKKVYIVGLATDYCVKYTAIDAVNEGFSTYVIKDCTRAVNLKPGDFEKAIEEMRKAGTHILTSKDLIEQ